MQAPISVADLQTFDSTLGNDAAQAMIATAWARAQVVAPCLKQPDPDLDDTDIEILKDVVRSAILRWNDRGSGAIVSRNAGEYGETLNRADDKRALYRPGEIRDLQAVCGNVRKRGQASTISTIPHAHNDDAGVDPVHPFLLGDDDFTRYDEFGNKYQR